MFNMTFTYYALPRIVSITLYAPINVVQGIYAKHYGMALTTIATIIFFSRVFDAVTDPFIGYLSDKYKLKKGTRKPIIGFGAILLVGSGYCLYLPPDDVSVFYFAFWFMAFYLGMTLFEIPHLAWGGELTSNTHQKTQIYNIRTAAGFMGLALFYSIPLLPFWETSEITPETLRFTALLSCGLIVPLLYFCMSRVPDGACFNDSPPTCADSPHRKRSLKKLQHHFSYIFRNRPLLIFLSAFIFAGTGLGMWYGLIFIFVDAYLRQGALFAEVYLVSFGLGVFVSLGWISVARCLGKKYTWMLAMLPGIVSFIYSGFLTPENTGYWALLVLLILNTLCITCLESLPQSILSDIVDYSTLKFRTYRGATYFSLYVFFYKTAFAVGTAVGLAVAGCYGFDPSSSVHTESGIQGLMLVMTSLPTLLFSISVFFIAWLPINARRHDIIRRRLDSLQARSNKSKNDFTTLSAVEET